MMSTKTKNIERRNIQISGGSTYVISLPKKWIEKLNLKNGDSMQIVNNANNSITLSADSIQEESTTYPEIKIKKNRLCRVNKAKNHLIIHFWAQFHGVKLPKSKN